MVSKPDPNAKRDDVFIYPQTQPEVVKLTRAQQARQDQIALAGRAKLASLSARLEAVRAKPEPESLANRQPTGYWQVPNR